MIKNSKKIVMFFVFIFLLITLSSVYGENVTKDISSDINNTNKINMENGIKKENSEITKNIDNECCEQKLNNKSKDIEKKSANNSYSKKTAPQVTKSVYLSLSAPSEVRPGQYFTIRLTGTDEVGAYVFGTASINYFGISRSYSLSRPISITAQAPSKPGYYDIYATYTGSTSSTWRYNVANGYVSTRIIVSGSEYTSHENIKNTTTNTNTSNEYTRKTNTSLTINSTEKIITHDQSIMFYGKFFSSWTQSYGNLIFSMSYENNTITKNIKTNEFKYYSMTIKFTENDSRESYEPGFYASNIILPKNTIKGLLNFTVQVKYDGDKYYNPCTSDTLTFTLDSRINTTTNLTYEINDSNGIVRIKGVLLDKYRKKLANEVVDVWLNSSEDSYHIVLKTDANGSFSTWGKPDRGIYNVTTIFNETDKYTNNTKQIKVNVKKGFSEINIFEITDDEGWPLTGGTIGEKLRIKAQVTVRDSWLLNEDKGTVIFKINGITIKDNGKLTGSSKPLKAKLNQGIATITIIPDINMRNAKTITAHYTGSDNFYASVSKERELKIYQRYANITVSSNVKKIKQGQILTLIAKIYDTTHNKNSTNLIKYADEFVYFKVNGITLKNSKGQMLKAKVINGTATIKYKIPLGLSGITDGKTKKIKNHVILAGFYNKNYKENVKNTNTFQVERSNITIAISNVTIDKKTHKLSLTATIKDYLGNKVVGPNKCIIKVNGATLKNGTRPIYYFASYGVLNIKDINIPAYKKYTNIEIVTQDRLAYKSQRNTTTSIKVK
ncbi:MAG: Ig-like domain repeat protein [Methanosphaera stadtmanae]|jgi:hypothetical protein|nr:Ig-like domain repeat protein [Methanosphaera stadtmanae]